LVLWCADTDQHCSDRAIACTTDQVSVLSFAHVRNDHPSRRGML
jgi:hypothetical protein